MNGLKIHFREIDQIIYDMKTILNNEAGFPVEKMMIIKKLLDLQYETLAVSQQPVFIIDINFCRQAVVQIVKLKKQIEAKRPIVIPDVVVAPKPQTKVQTPPKVVVDQTEKIAAKTLEILQRDYSEPEPKILTAKYCCTLGKPNLLENNERQRDLDGQGIFFV